MGSLELLATGKETILIPLFFIVAVLYSSVGLGGGSSYLALMALLGIEYHLLRATALFCNITVVSGGAYIFWRNGYLNFRKALPIVLVSVPLAFLGGSIPIKERTFFILLGIVLLVAAILMWFQPVKRMEERKGRGQTSLAVNAGLGGGVGFLAGMVGIGGGIFLAPVLHLIRWDTVRKIAATASFFILLNSMSGLAGQFSQADFVADWPFSLKLMLSVFVGGQIGSRLGARGLAPHVIKRWTAVLIFVVSLRVLYKYALI